MQRTLIKAALGAGQATGEVLIKGWVRTRRDSKTFSFLELNDGSCLTNLQVVVDTELTDYPVVQQASTGAAVQVTGALVDSPGKGQRWELHARSLKLLGSSPDDYPLLGFISLMAPAIARGNTIVIIPSEKHPLSATDFYQILDTSDVPGGVVNIVTGDRDHLTKTLVEHEDVDAMWYFGTAEGSYEVENRSVVNMKRTWVGYGITRDWADPEQGEGEDFLHEATQVKNIWVPSGE